MTFAMSFPSLPIIGDLELKIQLSILATLLAIGYFHRVSRLVLSGLISLYIAYTFLIPIATWTFGWVIWLVKAVAMLGFYIHFFQLGLGYLAAGVAFLSSDAREWLVKGLEAYESARS